MSHYIAEVIVPPNRPVQESVAEVFDGFKQENGEADWWDFYIIGGRFSGHKLECSIEPCALNDFHQVLQDRKVTVSSFTAGKQELKPASQQAMVDELWREMFPGKGDICPLFNHGRDQYRKDGYYIDDVCTVAEIHERLTCSRLIVAGKHWKHDDHLEARRMLVHEFWNGVDWQTTLFDGNVKNGLEQMGASHRKLECEPDWLVVTVDYHN